MDFVKNYGLIAFLAVGSLGCASSSYRHVLVSVVDSNTGQPVEGATVSSSHPVKPWLVRAFRPGTQAVTGRNGTAIILAKSNDPLGPIFDVKIVNKYYDQYFGYSETRNDWMNRSENFIPTEPDIVLEDRYRTLHGIHFVSSEKLNQPDSNQTWEELLPVAKRTVRD